jgi:tripartite motif-containing protein 71
MESTCTQVLLLISIILFTPFLIQNSINIAAAFITAEEKDPFGQHTSAGNQFENVSDGSLKAKDRDGGIIFPLDNNSTFSSTFKGNRDNKSGFSNTSSYDSSQNSKISDIVKENNYDKSNDSSLNESSLNNGTINDKASVYVVDYANIRIQKFDSRGHFITKWGTEGVSDLQFRVPHSIAVDSSNKIYVTDMTALKVKKFDSDGHFITKWGTEGTGNGQFSHPHGIVADNSGNIYITDMRNFNIQKFDSDGHFITKWGTEGTGNGQFKAPEEWRPIPEGMFTFQIQ